MPTYVLLTKLSPDVARQMENREEMGRAWLDQVRKTCPEVKFISHYALLGQFDFMDIYEAPDDRTAHKVSLIGQANGALQAQSLPAMPYMEYLELISEL
jgi:uncharacterized protein with GYD domain